jgi:hypothetical protein
MPNFPEWNSQYTPDGDEDPRPDCEHEWELRGDQTAGEAEEVWCHKCHTIRIVWPNGDTEYEENL